MVMQVIKVSTWLVGRYAMEAYGGVEVEVKGFFFLALDGDEWSVSCPSQFNPSRKAASN
jgi:hypothetical protein